MPASPRTYRKKPLAVFEHGTRIYAPSRGVSHFRVVATDPTGKRIFAKHANEADARARARDLEAFLAAGAPCAPTRPGPAPWPPWPPPTTST